MEQAYQEAFMFLAGLAALGGFTLWGIYKLIEKLVRFFRGQHGRH